MSYVSSLAGRFANGNKVVDLRKCHRRFFVAFANNNGVCKFLSFYDCRLLYGRKIGGLLKQVKFVE